MKRIIFLIFYFVSFSTYSSVNEDFEVLTKVFDSPPNYKYKEGYTFPYNPPDFRLWIKSLSLMGTQDADKRREYEEGGILFQWDNTTGLLIDDYLKFCNVETIKDTKKNTSSKWNRRAKKILNSSDPDIYLALEKQKFKNANFLIQGEYSIAERKIGKDVINSLDNLMLTCHLQEGVIINDYRGERYDVKKVINTNLNPECKQNLVNKIKDIKSQKKSELEYLFNNLTDLKDYRSISRTRLDKLREEPKIDKYETCKEFGSRALKFLEGKRRIAYATIDLSYDPENETLSFNLEGYGDSKLDIPEAHHDMAAKVISGNETSLAYLTKDDTYQHVISFLGAAFHPQLLYYPRESARENFDNLSGLMLFEYLETYTGTGGCDTNRKECSVLSEKIIGYAIKDTVKNEFIYMVPDNGGLKPKKSFEVSKNYCSIRSFVDLLYTEYSWDDAFLVE